MAGEWIKLEHETPDKPEIVQMAASLQMDQDAVFGKCLRLWIWADQQSIDGNALSVTETFLDRLTYCPGFAGALRQVGWLNGRDGRLSIPNFGRHNGQTAKKRALTRDRVKKTREECNAASVTKTLPEGEIEIEVESKNKRRRAPLFRKPTLDEVQAYILERGSKVSAQRFCDYYESNGWKVGRNPMRCWKATVRQWESRESEFTNSRAAGNGKRLTAAQQREQGNADAFAVLESLAADDRADPETPL